MNPASVDTKRGKVLLGKRYNRPRHPTNDRVSRGVNGEGAPPPRISQAGTPQMKHTWVVLDLARIILGMYASCKHCRTANIRACNACNFNESQREREREIRRNTSPRFAPKESTHNCVHLTIEIIVNEWNARWWWLETHVTARFTCPNTEGGEGRVLESSTILRALRNRALLHADPIHPVFICFSIRGKKRAETHK